MTDPAFAQTPVERTQCAIERSYARLDQTPVRGGGGGGGDDGRRVLEILDEYFGRVPVKEAKAA